MKVSLAAAILIILSAGGSAWSHRLDEYLQATTISLEKDRIQAQIRLTPGVAVVSFVVATIDRNRDGALSQGEQRAYAEQVLGDLSLVLDGDRLKPRIVTTSFPAIDTMREGLGEIHIDFAADVRRDSPRRKLVFANHHQRAISTYLVNCLVPRDPEIRIATQHRNYEQSRYELSYLQPGTGPHPLFAPAALALLLVFVIPMRRIVHGTQKGE